MKEKRHLIRSKPAEWNLWSTAEPGPASSAQMSGQNPFAKRLPMLSCNKRPPVEHLREEEDKNYSSEVTPRDPINPNDPCGELMRPLCLPFRDG